MCHWMHFLDLQCMLVHVLDRWLRTVCGTSKISGSKVPNLILGKNWAKFEIPMNEHFYFCAPKMLKSRIYLCWTEVANDFHNLPS